MPRYYLKVEDFQLLLLLKELWREETKYWQTLALSRCMADKENIYLDYSNPRYMAQTNFILTAV
jgi:hypothetical protein